MLQGFDEYLARGVEEALGDDCTETCLSECVCGQECIGLGGA